MKKTKWIVLLVACFSSCVNNSGSNRGKIVFNKNGSSFIIPYLLKGNDTLYDGTAKYYYPTGVKSDEITYVLNKKDGWHTHYDSGGLMRSKIMYKNNLANGIGLFYNSKGNLEVENFYLDDKLLFAKWFHSNGKIRAYTAMNDTLTFYSIEFDSSGSKKFEKGYVFSLSESCFYPNLDSVKREQEFNALIPIAAIPGYSVKIEVAKFDSIGVMIGESEVIPLSKYFALYKTTFAKSGKYRIGVAGELRDEKGNILRNDTLLIHLNVIK